MWKERACMWWGREVNRLSLKRAEQQKTFKGRCTHLKLILNCIGSWSNYLSLLIVVFFILAINSKWHSVWKAGDRKIGGHRNFEKLCSREGKTMNDNFQCSGTRALVYLGNHRIVPGNLSVTTKFSQLHPWVQCPFLWFPLGGRGKKRY